MSSKCFLCEENMFLREHFKYFCVNCSSSTLYCLKCNKHLETLLHCTFFKCFNCKTLTRTTKIETVSASNNELLQHLFKNNTQEQLTFRHYFNLNDHSNLLPFSVNYSNPITQPQSCWVNSERKGGNSKGSFIILSKEKEHNFINSENINPTVIPSNDPQSFLASKKENVINTEIKNINIPNVLNITDELNHKCNLTLDKNDNNFPNLINNSAIELRGSTNLNFQKPKSMLRQVVEETTSKISGKRNQQVVTKYRNKFITCSPKQSSYSKLDSSIFSAYNKSESKISKSPSVSNFKDSLIKKSPNRSLFSELN